jgi:hypothetical protein
MRMRHKLGHEKRNSFLCKLPQLTRTQYEALAVWAESAMAEHLDGNRIALASRRETAVTAKEAQQLMRAICADLGTALPKTCGWRFLLEDGAETNFLLSGNA